MTNNYFEVEQAIMNCWQVVDDLKILLKRYDSLSEDEQLNILIGIQNLYQLKFEDMLDTFNEYVHSRMKPDPLLDGTLLDNGKTASYSKTTFDAHRPESFK
jgi:hypothetical protein